MPSIQLTDGWGLYHRSDIGSEQLLAKRGDVAERVRRLYRYKEEHGMLGRRMEWVPRVGSTDSSQLLLQEMHGSEKAS
jgi:hypothetical protein